MFYNVLYGNEITNYRWKTFAYHSRTSSYKILYTRSYKAEIAAGNSRTCAHVISDDFRMLYNGGCKKTIPVFLLQTVLSAYNINFSLPDLIPWHKIEH